MATEGGWKTEIVVGFAMTSLWLASRVHQLLYLFNFLAAQQGGAST